MDNINTPNLDTLCEFVKHWSDTIPDCELFVFYRGEVRTSYTCRRVYELAGRFSRRLRTEYGFQKGDIIANTLPNSPERLLTDLGIMLAGCISLNLEIMFSDGSDFMTSARNSRLCGVILCPEGETAAWKILSPFVVTSEVEPATSRIAWDSLPDLRTAILVSRLPQGKRKAFLEDLENDNTMFVEENIRPEDVVYVLTTSGSTGYCKLVPRSHTEMINIWKDVITPIREEIGVDFMEQDIIQYNDRTIGWMGGYPFGTYIYGHKRVLLDVFQTHGSKTYSDVWAIIVKEQANFSTFLPQDLMNTIKSRTDNYRIKVVLCGGQPIKKDQYSHYFSVADFVWDIYGSTEGGIIAGGFLNDTTKDYFCGQLLKPDRQLRVVKEDGTLAKPGEMGTIEVKGRGVFKGYLNRVEDPDPKTLLAFTPDGWFKMDDTGYLDEDNNLYCLGRLKDVINFGSTFIYPAWLEARIVLHPEIEEAAVVPVSDPLLYQNICAFVQTVPGSQLDEQGVKELFESFLMEEEDIEGTPVPKFVVILDNIPRNSNGKLDRKTLTKMAEERFGIK